MSTDPRTGSPQDEEAAELFVRRMQEDWTEQDQAALDERRMRDHTFAHALSRVEASWSVLEGLAESPEVMGHRETALASVRRANVHRWRSPDRNRWGRWRVAAACFIVAAAIAVGWEVSPYGFVPGQYETRVGEQRILELDDHSRITLDAVTKIRVRFSKDARIVKLIDGQAQFNVAHDAARPFKVLAGDREIVAVGTVFTVEYADQQVHVAMLEGKVAVLNESSESGGYPQAALSAEPERNIELAAGEELHVNARGHAVVTPKADLEAATAWRDGKIIFRSEALGEAIRRVNRYSRVQLVLEAGTLSSSKISGVFEAGDTQGFVDAIERYLPLTAHNTRPDRIQLRAR
jgi:transmembrane sensor